MKEKESVEKKPGFNKEMGEQFADFLNKMQYVPSNQQKPVLSESIVASELLGVLPVSPMQWLKYKLFRSKGWVWLMKVPLTGRISLKFVKNPTTVFFGGKKNLERKVEITQIFHFWGGKPFHVCIEGLPTNVSLNKQFTASEYAPLINQAIVRSYQIGVSKGSKISLGGALGSPLVLILLIGLIVAVGVSIYLGIQAQDAVLALKDSVNSLVAATG